MWEEADGINSAVSDPEGVGQKPMKRYVNPSHDILDGLWQVLAEPEHRKRRQRIGQYHDQHHGCPERQAGFIAVGHVSHVFGERCVLR